MVQIDGSHHRCFEQRGQERCLMSMVDDATGRAVYLLSEKESSEAVLTILLIWITLYGIPHNRPRPRPKDLVIVQDWLDGSLHIYFKGKELKVCRK